MGKTYFTIKLEALVPTELTYKIYAEDADEALKLLDRSITTLSDAPKLRLSRMKKLKAKIFLLGSSVVIKIKDFKL